MLIEEFRYLNLSPAGIVTKSSLNVISAPKCSSLVLLQKGVYTNHQRMRRLLYLQAIVLQPRNLKLATPWFKIREQRTFFT